MPHPREYRDKDIVKRTYSLAIEVVRFVVQLPRNEAGRVLGKQVLRSGTSIGANVRESQKTSTKKAFIHKLNIALDEAEETEYWLGIIRDSGLFRGTKLEFLLEECGQICRVLTVIIKNSKR